MAGDLLGVLLTFWALLSLPRAVAATGTLNRYLPRPVQSDLAALESFISVTGTGSSPSACTRLQLSWTRVSDAMMAFGFLLFAVSIAVPDPPLASSTDVHSRPSRLGGSLSSGRSTLKSGRFGQKPALDRSVEIARKGAISVAPGPEGS